MIVTRLDIGGTETYILSLSKALLSKGIQVGVATAGGPLLNEYRKAGIQVHFVPQFTNYKANSGKQLLQILQKHHYQIMNAHDSSGYRGLIQLRKLISPLKNTPFVLTAHGLYHSPRLLKNASTYALRVIAVSPVVSNWLVSHGMAKQKITVIPNGINTSIFKPSLRVQNRKSLSLPLQGKMIAYAGRLSHDKAFIAEHFIQSVEKVAQIHPKTIGVIMGTGTHFTQLQDLAASVNKRFDKQVIYVKSSSTEIEKLYCAADVVVGTGRVALEAMACSKPVIATGLAGYHGIVTPQNLNQGIETQFGDHSAKQKLTVPILTQDLMKLIKNPNWANKLGVIGKQTIENRFSIDQVSDQILNLYQSSK